MHVSVANSPPKLTWRLQEFMRVQVFNKISFLRASYERKQISEIYELSKKAANSGFQIRVIDSGWANQRCLADENYKVLTNELAEISKEIGAFAGGNIDIPVALHWSRRYEYPLAILSSISSERPLRGFKILDSGANIDPIQFYLARRGYEVYSLDLDLVALEQVARFGSKYGLKNLYPTYGNTLDLPFPNSYFDRVLNISVLEHIVYHVKKDTGVILKGFINELLRVLKPKGLVVLTFDVNMNPKKSDLRLYFHEYESLCRMLGILPTHPPPNRLCSSDTEEGRRMGEDLCTYYAILAHASSANVHLSPEKQDSPCASGIKS